MIIKNKKQGWSVALRWRVSLVLGLILAIGVGSFSPFYTACAQVRQHTLRLHILANSDSAEDQALKLAVRDAILAQEGDALSGAQTKEEAIAKVRVRLEAIEETARAVVRAQGYNYTVTARLEQQYFATRVYDDFTLPAGVYDAVRIEIGSHEGQNWFCVLFPPLCVPAASAQTDTDDLPGYTAAESSAVYSGYRVKFAAVELLERLRSKA
jgi:stage II sporulation protein R